MTSRVHLPEEVKRQVRWECGFGCVICGNVLVEYEHIVPYSVCKEHKVGNIALLCPNHHRDVTSNRLSKQAVFRARQSPFALKADSPRYNASPLLGRHITVAGNNFGPFSEGSANIVFLIFDKPMMVLHRDEGVTQLSMEISSHSGERLILIERNIIIFKKDRFWDICLSGRFIRVRRGPRKIFFKMEFRDEELVLHKFSTCVGNINVVATGVSLITSGAGSFMVQNLSFQPDYDAQMTACFVSIESQRKGWIDLHRVAPH